MGLRCEPGSQQQTFHIVLCPTLGHCCHVQGWTQTPWDYSRINPSLHSNKHWRGPLNHSKGNNSLLKTKVSMTLQGTGWIRVYVCVRRSLKSEKFQKKQDAKAYCQIMHKTRIIFSVYLNPPVFRKVGFHLFLSITQNVIEDSRCSFLVFFLPRITCI